MSAGIKSSRKRTLPVRETSEKKQKLLSGEAHALSSLPDPRRHAAAVEPAPAALSDARTEPTAADTAAATYMTDEQAQDPSVPVPLPILIHRDDKRKRRRYWILYHLDNPKGFDAHVNPLTKKNVKSFAFLKSFDSEKEEFLVAPAGTFFRRRGTSKNIWFGCVMSHNGHPPSWQQASNQDAKGFQNSPLCTTLIRDLLSMFTKGRQIKHLTHSLSTLQNLARKHDITADALLDFISEHRPDVKVWEERIREEMRRQREQDHQAAAAAAAAASKS
jgi:hypothetical protein